MITPHVWRLSECLLRQPLAVTDVLNIYLTLIVHGHAAVLRGELAVLHTLGDRRSLTATNVHTGVKVISAIGRLSDDNAARALQTLCDECHRHNGAAVVTVILKEVQYL